MRVRRFIPTIAASVLSFFALMDAQHPEAGEPLRVPVTVDGDTVLYLSAHLGPFSPQQRARAASEKLKELLQSRGLEAMDTVRVHETLASSNLVLDSLIIMAVTKDDASLEGKTRQELAHEYALLITRQLHLGIERYSTRSLMVNSGIVLGLLLLLGIMFWVLHKVFPRWYALLERWEGTIIPSIHIRTIELISAGSIISAAIFLAKGLRLAVSLGLIDLFLIYSLSLFPWTRTLNLQPLLGGLFLVVLTSIAALTLFKGINATFRSLRNRLPGWKGTLIQPVMVKSAELISAERIAELVDVIARTLQIAAHVLLAYAYATFVFSLFEFTSTWSATLFHYVTTPLWTALEGFVAYLPNIFTIAIIVVITHYLLKLIRFLFSEMSRGTMAFPGFYPEWAEPTYKIVRFLVLVFAAIVIFPYLPGSTSPFFQGISIFIGVLFSLGSSSAIANIVAGVVITYMRPFRIGDRVKIADTMGDVMEKTLLVTRIRTTKNVDITIPNSMVLGSHIINYSSSAQERGLILHTTVTIGYDVPWKTVHALLIEAAKATENIIKEPGPFVLQTGLDDFSVRYELNAYTNAPNRMSQISSTLHANIQDAFNRAGVEIMSPHYSALRDGNRTTVPEDFLPKEYSTPAFTIAATVKGGGEHAKIPPKE